MEFLGDLENLSNVQIELLKSILNNHGFSDCKVNVEPVGKRGDNYASTVVRILAEKDEKSLRMIAKIAPKHEVAREMINSVILFGNEILMYNKVLPKLVELQKSAGLTESELFKYPLCYGAIEDAPNEFIVLEDLKEENFHILDRMVSLTDKEIKMVLDKLAMLHSMCFVLKTKEPELFDEYKSKLIDMWSAAADVEEANKGFQLIENSILELLPEDKRIYAKGTVADVPITAAEFHKSDMNSKYSVILQGDCWINNIMFKTEEGSPVDCVMIDYQISRACSPVIDILYLIFNCTDRETRAKHYHDWIDYYYKKLDNTLLSFGLKATHIYPRDQLDADLKRYGKFAFGLSLVLASVLTRESDESIQLIDMTEKANKENMMGFSNVKEVTMLRLKKKVEDLYESFAQYDYI